MNSVELDSLAVSGTGTVTSGKSILERMAEESEGGILKTESNEEVPTQVVKIEKHAIGEKIVEEQEAFVEQAKTAFTPAVELKKSIKSGFNPNSTTSAMAADSENDGGLMSNRVSSPNHDEGTVFKPIGMNVVEIDTRNKFEVSGFSIQYQPKGSKGVASEEVRDYYDSLNEALERFKDDIYTKPDGVPSRISRGAPSISFNDRQVREYVNETWRKS